MYSLLFHENIRIFKAFRSIVNMLRALILLTRKCHNIIKHSFSENIKELDYLLISYGNWNVLHFPHSAFSSLRTFHTPHFPHSSLSTLRTPYFRHSALYTLRTFHTPHSAFSTEVNLTLYRVYMVTTCLRYRICRKGYLMFVNFRFEV